MKSTIKELVSNKVALESKIVDLLINFLDENGHEIEITIDVENVITPLGRVLPIVRVKLEV